MKIRKLEIAGFKSFVDRTVLHFDQDVIAVVGPNGCGKSNVVDAIRWAMGEQSPQRLRGKAMEDVIFNGSESRGPHGFAEVSVVFDNRDGLAPPEYAEHAEITVARRLDRQGRSDYFINKTPVRLLDVTNLFLGTGVGRRAYSIVEQGRIGFIVSSKAEDRRYLIEEAAGVTKFKVRRRTAERKMEQTRQNLLRVGDIVQELERNLGVLKRQAQKAERYKQYRVELRDLELLTASHKWLELTAVHRVAAATLTEAEARAEGVRSALRLREAELEAERVALHLAETEVERAQNRAYELDNTVRVVEGQIAQQLERYSGLRESERLAERELDELRGQRSAVDAEICSVRSALESTEEREATEQAEVARRTEVFEIRRLAVEEAERAVGGARSRLAEAEARVARADALLLGVERRKTEGRARREKLAEELEGIRGHVSSTEDNVRRARLTLTQCREECDQLTERERATEATLEALRPRVHDSEVQAESIRMTLGERRSRLRSLEELDARLEGVSSGVRVLVEHLGRAGETRKASLVVDHLTCPSAFTRALSGVLGDRLHYVVVSDHDAAVSAAGFLSHEEAGRATAIPRSPARVVGARRTPPRHPGVIGLFIDLVAYSAEGEAIARHLLDDILVVDDLATASDLWRNGHWAGTIVTREGEIIREDGTITAGTEEGSAGYLLALKAEATELHDTVRALDGELTAAVRLLQELREQAVTLQAEVDALRLERHAQELRSLAADKDLTRVTAELERSRERAVRVEADLEEIDDAFRRSDDEEAEAHAEVEAARKAEAEARVDLATREEAHRERRTEAGEHYRRVTEAKVKAAEARQKAEGNRSTMDRLARSLEELESRQQRLGRDVVSGAEQQGRIIGEVWCAKEHLSSVRSRTLHAQHELLQLRDEYEEARHQVSKDELELRDLRRALESQQSQLGELTLRERELAMELVHLLDQVFDKYRTDLRQLLGDYHFRPMPDDSTSARMQELALLIERMGEINLTAIEEHEDKSKRYEFLSAQKRDLEEALVQLERAIRQMNRESRRRFRETFDAVNERFRRIFPRMFGGGRAELRLTDPDDLLESGMDIVAQPPGKKLGSLELMSGGEKALTAVSLIFALFQYKPTPFCLLDEVDAPLDETNIDRFTEAVRQMTDRSQFILITHSKRTMEAADLLYGVTMEQPGISKLVSVSLREGPSRARAPQTEQAAVA